MTDSNFISMRIIKSTDQEKSDENLIDNVIESKVEEAIANKN